MFDHLAEAKSQAKFSHSAVGAEWAQYNAQLATAHAAIALVELLAERLPPPAETASECRARLREEEHDNAV